MQLDNLIFNISDVIFYRATSARIKSRANISIHPMLFFIPYFGDIGNGYLEFQYILCYFLSLQSWNGISNPSHFNTSYVIFYQNNPAFRSDVPEFQYILCYFLSANLNYIDDSKETFQYILCYFLSPGPCKKAHERQISIHPMLFFIPDGAKRSPGPIRISIHPMLFFIMFWLEEEMGYL